MNYSIHYRSYTRSFQHPLTTAHGVWSVREGVILELRSSDTPDTLPDSPGEMGQGEMGQGEIAPLPWFGSETQAEALEFCRSLTGQIDDDTIDTIPDRLPACQFAFESARASLSAALHRSRSPRSPRSPFSPTARSIKPRRSLDICRLLPAGHHSLAALDRHPKHRTYKWKIATASMDDERAIFDALLDRLPPKTTLRLDANGGLNYDQACRWLEICDRVNQSSSKDHTPIEFLEQPLPPAQDRDLSRLSEAFATPIALDESIANLTQLHTAQTHGWHGLYVIKPAIIGSPRRLRSLCTQYQLDTVFSSVFETAIGRDAGLRLAHELQTRDRAVGYGLDDWLAPPDSPI